MCRFLLASILMTLPAAALAASPGADPISALVSDPPQDAAHPAKLEQVRYPTDGVQVPARMLVASGAGPHPTVLLLHGFPGTELNLDLARVLQRDGWNVLAIHYRGVWGSPGSFSFSNVAQDAHAALAWLRSPAAAPYGTDIRRIVVLGHSMGGFATAMTGDDKDIAGFVLISPADMMRHAVAASADPKLMPGFADDASYTNASVDSLVADARAHLAEMDWPRRAAQMAGRPVLVITSDDGLAAAGDAAAAAVARAGGPKATVIHMTTDHSYNDHRVGLATAIVNWLRRSVPRR